MSEERLKLRAEDEEDVAVLSACLQDALVSISEMDYFPEENRFAFVANRFRWENCEQSRADCGAFERIHCGVTIEGVASVKSRNIDRKFRGQVLDLLAIEVDEQALKLLFAGGGVIALEVQGILCLVQDLGEPWPTRWQPRHSALDDTQSTT